MAGSDETEQMTAGQTVVSFQYDALDTLIGRSASGGREQRFYRNDELVNEIHGANSSTFVRANDLVLAEQQAGDVPKTLLLAGDDKNSVLVEVSQGAVKATAYSAYGHRTDDDASLSSHLGYNGERRETQTGWYLLGRGYRVFNPVLMRFHSPDNLSPFGRGGLNAYMYCVGDPINNVDPTGHIGFFKRLFRANTSSSVAGKLGKLLAAKPDKNEDVLLKTITPKDVEKIDKVRDLLFRQVQKTKRRSTANINRGASGNTTEATKATLEKMEVGLKAYSEAFEIARKRVGKKGITGYAREEIEKQLKFYSPPPKNNNIRDEVPASMEEKVTGVRMG